MAGAGGGEGRQILPQSQRKEARSALQALRLGVCAARDPSYFKTRGSGGQNVPRPRSRAGRCGRPGTGAAVRRRGVLRWIPPGGRRPPPLAAHPGEDTAGRSQSPRSSPCSGGSWDHRPAGSSKVGPGESGRGAASEPGPAPPPEPRGSLPSPRPAAPSPGSSGWPRISPQSAATRLPPARDSRMEPQTPSRAGSGFVRVMVRFNTTCSEFVILMAPSSVDGIIKFASA